MAQLRRLTALKVLTVALLVLAAGGGLLAQEEGGPSESGLNQVDPVVSGGLDDVEDDYDYYKEIDESPGGGPAEEGPPSVVPAAGPDSDQDRQQQQQEQQQPPSVTIETRVISNTAAAEGDAIDDVTTEGPVEDTGVSRDGPDRIRRFLSGLTDTWWKLLAWGLVLGLLLLVLAYISRCCYLVWDCCVDPYWGCCPRREGCRRFLLLQCCSGTNSKDEPSSSGGGKPPRRLKKRGGFEYQMCSDDHALEDLGICTGDGSEVDQLRGSPPDNDADDDGLDSSSEIEFTLRRVDDVVGPQASHSADQGDSYLMVATSRWQDTSLTVLSSLGNQSPSKESLDNSDDDGSEAAPARPLLTSVVEVAPVGDLAGDRVSVSSACGQNGFSLETTAMVTSTPKRSAGTRKWSPTTTTTTTKDVAPYNPRPAHSFPPAETILELSGEEEGLPHLYADHYFNLFHALGLGGAKYEYSLARPAASSSSSAAADSLRKGSTVPGPHGVAAAEDSRGFFRKPKVGTGAPAPKAEAKASGGSRKASASSAKANSSANHGDFLLSDSFSNVSSLQRYGLNIEEGRSGTYSPLPEAQSQLMPPDKFVQLHNGTVAVKATTHAEKKAMMANRRRSRSVDTFSKLQATTLTGSVNAIMLPGYVSSSGCGTTTTTGLAPPPPAAARHPATHSYSSFGSLRQHRQRQRSAGDAALPGPTADIVLHHRPSRGPLNGDLGPRGRPDAQGGGCSAPLLPGGRDDDDKDDDEEEAASRTTAIYSVPDRKKRCQPVRETKPPAEEGPGQAHRQDTLFSAPPAEPTDSLGMNGSAGPSEGLLLPPRPVSSGGKKRAHSGPIRGLHQHRRQTSAGGGYFSCRPTTVLDGGVDNEVERQILYGRETTL